MTSTLPTVTVSAGSISAATSVVTVYGGTVASGSTLTLDLAYTISGTSPMGSFTATTVDTDTATRQ